MQHLDNRWTVRRDAAQQFAQVLEVTRAFSGVAEAAGDGEGVWDINIDPKRSDLTPPHVALDLVIVVVVPQQHDDADPGLRHADQFRQDKLQAAVAYQADHRASRLTEFGADDGGQAITEGVVAGGGVKLAARLVKIDQVATAVNGLGRAVDGVGVQPLGGDRGEQLTIVQPADEVFGQALAHGDGVSGPGAVWRGLTAW